MQKPLYLHAFLLTAGLGLSLNAPVTFAAEDEHGHAAEKSITETLQDEKKDLLRKQIEAEAAVPRDTVVAEVNGEKNHPSAIFVIFPKQPEGRKGAPSA
jgi:hypothetical protein